MLDLSKYPDLPKEPAAFTCPECGNDIRCEYISLALVSEYPELDDAIDDGSFFEVVCPHCKTVHHYQQGFMYMDKCRRIMIYVCNSETDTKKLMDSIGDNLKAAASQYYIVRIVPDVYSLLEKRNLFRLGMDDRAVEVIKMDIKGNLLTNGKIQNTDTLRIYYEVDKTGRHYLNVTDKAYGIDGCVDVKSEMYYLTELMANRKLNGIRFYDWLEVDEIWAKAKGGIFSNPSE